ncbi:MAG: alanine--tRNA ligase, partial [Burkholderiaceae bacterium]
LTRLGEKSNFWAMGDTGPCGPCSEIFYDHGEEVAGGPPGSPDEDGDRYIEIWNLVFMQYDRNEAGVLNPLPRPCVDTGMGLERIAAVLQGVHSNYEIDLFQGLIRAAARETGCTDIENPSLRVIADHIRACSFLIVDGVIPGNEGRGYVLRRIVRRALRHGHKLGQTKPFFYKLVPDLVAQMGEAYPELAQAQQRVADTLQQEEERFGETLEKGMAILSSSLAELPKGAALDGQTAFMLYDTYGFPLDLTADVCRERGLTVDEDAFEAAMGRQRDQARAASKFKSAAGLEYTGAQTQFVGYERLSQSATVTGLYRDGTACERAQAGDAVVVVLDTTPFYAESGGQVGDAGVLQADGLRIEIEDTQKISAEVFGHHGRVVQGEVTMGQALMAEVDLVRRARTARNHSVTHIMHKALREVLGAHVQQKGSLVDADKTRFDFAHNQPMTAQEIATVEAKVNAEILLNTPTQAQIMGFDEAVKGGATALFGEKYGDAVRVLDIGSSRELCGGTHVARTGDIGLFKLVSESGVAAGIRRVEAITGDRVLSHLQLLDQQVQQAAGLLKASPAELQQRLAQLVEANRTLEKEIGRLKSKLTASAGDDLADQAIAVGAHRLLATVIEGASSGDLRQLLDQLKSKLQSAAIVLASVEGEKVTIIAGVTPDLTAKIKAGDLVNHVASQVGGKGGGRPDMAQGGGTQPAALPGALESLRSYAKSQLGAAA